jgi:hypothetical protein
MTVACTHLEQVLVERPERVIVCEDWSHRYVDDVAFVLEGPA